MPSLQRHSYPRGPENELHAAAFLGATERVLSLLSTIHIDQGTPDGATPLMIAASVGGSHVTRVLLDKGANTSIQDDDGSTALHIAAEEGRLALTKMLTEAGSPVDSVTNEGHTPLFLTARQGHSEVMTVLLEAGANPNSRSHDGGTPLCCAAMKGFVEATRVLLRAKANAMLARTDGHGVPFVALELATHHGHSDVVSELIQQRGVEACGGPSGGECALRLAVHIKRLDIAELLLNAGAVDSGYVLIAAAGSGSAASVKSLLQQQHQKEGRSATRTSAYANSTCGRYGAPPLLHAMGFAGCCSPKIARLLVDAGASTSSNVRVKDKEGVVRFTDTPLAFVDMYLFNKQIGGARDATEEQLNRLKAIRRLLLQADAVHAVSWLWPSDAPRVACTSASPPRVTTPPTAMTSMLPIMRRRTSGLRRILVPAVLRYSKEP